MSKNTVNAIAFICLTVCVAVSMVVTKSATPIWYLFLGMLFL